MKASSLVLVVILAVLSCSEPVHAGPVISIRTDGNGQYDIYGEGFDKVGGVDLTVSYDTATHANPRLSGGILARSGMTVSNANTAGIIRLAILRAGREGISGAGGIATVHFDLTGASEGPVALSGNMVDVNGYSLPVKIISITGSKQTIAGTDGNGAQEGISRQLGSVTMAADIAKPAGKEKEKPDDEMSPQPPVDQGKQKSARATGERDDDQQTPPTKAQEKPAPRLISHTGIQERFITFKGEKSPKALIALFDNHEIAGLKQEPEIVIADGKTAMNVSIEAGLTGNDDPKFLLSGAKIRAVSKGDKGNFFLEILPEAKTCEVVLKVIGSKSIQEIPLTVAPLVELAAVEKETLSEEDIYRRMKKMTGRAGDVEAFNGCQADYVFTANFLHYRSVFKARKDKVPPATTSPLHTP